METAIIAILGAIFLAWLWRREPSGLSDEGHPPPSEARRSSLAARAVSAGSTSVAQTGSSPDWTLSPRMGGTPERWGLGLDDPWHDDDTLHHQHAFRHEYLDSSISQPSIFDDTFDSLTGTSAFSSFDDPMRMSDPFEHSVNPATGLPMIGAVDVAGNPFGVDFSDDYSSHLGASDDFSSSFDSHWHDDSWSSGGSSWNDD